MIKILLVLSVFVTSEIHAQQNYNKLNVKELDVTSRVNVTSTTKSSKPCPAMTETQRNAIATPLNGSCIYNTTTSKLNVYNGTVWKAAGGGVDNWLTATAYSVDDIVIESSKIYQCLTAHTSGTFATDLAALKWAEISSTIPVNLTGPITSVGNATSIASQTGTGSTFVVQNTPTLTTPNIGAATGTSLTLAGNISAYNYDKDNMLVNGNIENPLSTEWTCTVGTCTRTTTGGEFSRDTAALKVALSAQAMNVSQTVTTPSGIQKQGYARVIYRVPATMADFQICTLVDAAEQTCVPTANLIKDDTFRSIEIPLTFGTTSAGIKFKTTSSYTATAYFDGVILSQGLGLQNLQGDVVYSATISSGTTVSTSKSGWVSCTNSSSAVCTFQSGLFTVAPTCTATTDNSLTNVQGTNFTGSISTTSVTVFQAAMASGTPVNGRFYLTCVKQGNDYLAASSNVYSQASANYSRRAYTPTFTGFGTATNVECYESRDGEFLDVDCKFTSGTTTAVEARVSLPSGLTSPTFSQGIRKVGGLTLSAAAGGNSHVLLESGATYFTFGYEVGGTSAGLTKTTASNFVGSSSAVSFIARIPISGWSNSNVIVGSFENVPTTPGVVKPVLFSANITTTSGAISDNKGGIFTTCTAANPTICSHPGLISTPNCTMSADNTSTGSAQANWSAASTNSTQISIYTTNGSGTALASTKVKVICHGER